MLRIPLSWIALSWEDHGRIMDRTLMGGSWIAPSVGGRILADADPDALQVDSSCRLSVMGSPTCIACIGFPMRFVIPYLSHTYLLKISKIIPKIDFG